MDQRLLDALNNLSFALEEISEALKDKKGKKSDTTAALQSGDFSKTIQEINVGIKSIKKDTQEILKQQKTILELSKKNNVDKKTSMFESDSKKDDSIKKGVSSIILIAAGVLAIGLAFKLVGNVDFLSVIALGIAIYSVSVAFEKIAKLDLTFRKALIASSMMPIMAFGILMASTFLTRVSTMSIGQVITVASIAGLFYFVAPIISSMMDSMMNPTEMDTIGPDGKRTKMKTKKMDWSRLGATLVTLPFIMVSMSMGIMLSSRILSGVRPMGLGQIITSIAIAGMFSIAASGIKGLIHALTEESDIKGVGKTKGMDMSKLAKIAIFLPIVMIGISAAITVSSWVLSGIRPIGLFQAITAILIAGMFAVVSFGISKMLTAMKGLDSGDMIKAVDMLPLLLPAIALAITASSWILSKITPITLSNFLTGLAISVLFIAFSVTLLVLAKADILGKIKMRDVIMLPLLFIALSIAITASSWVLSKSVEIPLLKLLSILAFSVVLCVATIVVGFTLKLLTNIGTVTDYIKGGLSMVIIATSVMITSHILSLGNYSKYPSWKWSLSVGLSLALFGVGAVLLGTQVLNPLFYGGLGAIVLVAGTVVAASHILAFGNYSKYPSLKWGMGVGLSLAAFGAGAVLLGTQVLNPFFYGGLGEILLVAGTVVATSHILGKGNYSKYPTYDWAKGTGLALGAFGAGAVLLGFNVLNPFFYAGLKMILSVAHTIVDSSFILSRGRWDKGPTAKWASGISAVFKAFKPIFDISSGFSGLFGGGFKEINSNILTIANSMVRISRKFINSDTWKYPPITWSSGVSSNIRRYLSLSNLVSRGLDYLAVHSVNDIAHQMASTAIIFGKNSKYFDSNINPNFMKNISSNILYYTKLSNLLNKKDLGTLSKNSFFGDPISNVANGMVKLAKAYDRLSNSIRGFGSSLKTLDGKKLDQFRGMTSNIAVLSALDSRMFDNMLTVLESRSSVFAKMLNAQAPSGVKRSSVGDKKSEKKEPVRKGKHGDQLHQMDVLIDLMALLITQIGEGSTLDEFLQKKVGEKRGSSKS